MAAGNRMPVRKTNAPRYESDVRSTGSFSSNLHDLFSGMRLNSRASVPSSGAQRLSGDVAKTASTLSTSADESIPEKPFMESQPLLGAASAALDASDEDRRRDADEMTNFVETLLDRPELSKGNLSRTSLEHCQRKLLDVIAGRPVEGGANEDNVKLLDVIAGRPVGGGANEELIDVMIYK
eukprot:CAMPEP_0117616898 /NCGR_PEP_ID=MMETSP0784-20121206/85306_1 /TAXON_ID=39447 /ORGANISM="" /LENGTH=180 /DNA_ID=CAMNT_0005420707 /DNA_START=1 /DNA_END=539 /DNA_ORIENTATION=+